MIPAVDHPIWSQIAAGKKPVQSAKLAINLLIQGNSIAYAKDPSPASVKQIAIRTWKFTKFVFRLTNPGGLKILDDGLDKSL